MSPASMLLPALTPFKRGLWTLRLRAAGDIFEKLSFLRRAYALDAEVAAALQTERLRRLLLHAQANVPYYQRMFAEAGLESGQATPADLARLPLLDKATIQANWDDLSSRALPRDSWQVNASGGSTGVPGRFIQDAEYRRWSQATKLLFDGWSGVRPGDRKALLWGSERDLLLGKASPQARLGVWLRNELPLNAFRMGPEEMRRYVAELNTFRPAQILAYAESIFELSRFIEREGLRVHSPKAIMSSAGTLSDAMREQIARVFGCPVFNRYGSREVGDIACEDVPGEGLRVAQMTHVVELLTPDGRVAGPGEAGEVVITLLTNLAMPLIRYRIGDVARWQEGRECGRRLAEVSGRVSDYFVLKGGARVRVPTAFFAQEPWIEKYQVVQESVEAVRVFIVRGAQVAEGAAEARLLDTLRRVLPGCAVSLEYVPDIAPSASGKYRYTRSKVLEQQGAS